MGTCSSKGSGRRAASYLLLLPCSINPIILKRKRQRTTNKIGNRLLLNHFDIYCKSENIIESNAHGLWLSGSGSRHSSYINRANTAVLSCTLITILVQIADDEGEISFDPSDINTHIDQIGPGGRVWLQMALTDCFQPITWS
jgi:hypothetical protein